MALPLPLAVAIARRRAVAAPDRGLRTDEAPTFFVRSLGDAAADHIRARADRRMRATLAAEIALLAVLLLVFGAFVAAILDPGARPS